MIFAALVLASATELGASWNRFSFFLARCGFEQLAPDGSPVIRTTRGENNVYAFDVELP